MSQLTKAQLTEAQEELKTCIRKSINNKWFVHQPTLLTAWAEYHADTIFDLLSLLLNPEYILIEKEPTEKMIHAGYTVDTGSFWCPPTQKVFRAMLQAAKPVIIE